MQKGKMTLLLEAKKHFNRIFLLHLHTKHLMSGEGVGKRDRVRA
jgi:hypothetical protein